MTAVRHGATRGGKWTPEYRSWSSMRNRCYDTNYRNYRHYGGAGVTVCDRWRHDFAAFLIDMGPRPPGTTLDRVDRSRPYEPGNCRWATAEEQNNNTSRNVRLDYAGESLTIAQWARRLGVSVQTLKKRRHSGWSVEAILATPVRGAAQRTGEQ